MIIASVYHQRYYASVWLLIQVALRARTTFFLRTYRYYPTLALPKVRRHWFNGSQNLCDNTLFPPATNLGGAVNNFKLMLQGFIQLRPPSRFCLPMAASLRTFYQLLILCKEQENNFIRTSIVSRRGAERLSGIDFQFLVAQLGRYTSTFRFGIGKAANSEVLPCKALYVSTNCLIVWKSLARASEHWAPPVTFNLHHVLLQIMSSNNESYSAVGFDFIELGVIKKVKLPRKIIIFRAMAQVRCVTPSRFFFYKTQILCGIQTVIR